LIEWKIVNPEIAVFSDHFLTENELVS
jgi:hypothetical protein